MVFLKQAIIKFLTTIWIYKNLLKEIMKKHDLPKIIPIFPLSNFIIFPDTIVPLNIFEPRYIEMINDSMKVNKLIGLIQPKQNKISSILDLHETGCLGEITSFKNILSVLLSFFIK